MPPSFLIFTDWLFGCLNTQTCRAGVDLNRDFPDPILDGGKLGAKGTEQPETLAMMKWILSKHFVASASMHEVPLPYFSALGLTCSRI